MFNRPINGWWIYMDLFDVIDYFAENAIIIHVVPFDPRNLRKHWKDYAFFMIHGIVSQKCLSFVSVSLFTSRWSCVPHHLIIKMCCKARPLFISHTHTNKHQYLKISRPSINYTSTSPHYRPVIRVIPIILSYKKSNSKKRRRKRQTRCIYFSFESSNLSRPSGHRYFSHQQNSNKSNNIKHVHRQ